MSQIPQYNMVKSFIVRSIHYVHAFIYTDISIFFKVYEYLEIIVRSPILLIVSERIISSLVFSILLMVIVVILS